MKKNLIIIFVLTFFASCGNSPQNEHSYEKKITDSLENSKEQKTFKSIATSVQLQWLQGPFGDPAQESQFLMVLTNSKGQTVELLEEYSLKVTGIMPSMGHGTDWDGENIRLEKGLYFHKELFFNMPGDWVLYIDLMKNNEIVETINFDYML
ncbi:putative lipoprotein [Bacteriovorax sp. BSW11_IV]|uniref:hypothetical protein n=1 Tax=Bacteriovorax sp. BSW11_IV TaxID=1353529 RepID=UPI00038A0FC2|nr:hypothetical protein [Bacteriovorax sp. BSW11_IV]EQC44603.1 putative lipoprotein [Bacteriovorax sp. BSW11_IV]